MTFSEASGYVMPSLTTKEVVEQYIREIESQFPGVLFEFSTRVFKDHTELWVYVLDLPRHEEVRRYCKKLEGTPFKPSVCPWIFVKTWTGSWPGGDSEEAIKQRRNDFLKRQQGG